MERELTFGKAIREAIDQCMEADPNVYTLGLGVPDPGGVFGTTVGLREKHGPRRVLDMPVSENAMTGVALGSAITGLRPILSHQRMDFVLYAMDQMVNQAAKWHYMFDGRMKVPLVIRIVIGRGWGQGPQHAQSLQAWFAHVPGLKVVMPFTPHDAKGLLISAVEDDNPVLFFEHRWLHNMTGPVPEAMYRVPLGRARVVREGSDVTLAAFSHMTYEAVRAADFLAKEGIKAEVIDVRSLLPFDDETVLASVKKTKRVLVADTGNKTGGFAGEIVARITERAFDALEAPPVRVALPDHPSPTSPALTRDYYPRAERIVKEVRGMLGVKGSKAPAMKASSLPHDVPDLEFKGPF